jgi:hypothetical protein
MRIPNTATHANRLEWGEASILLCMFGATYMKVRASKSFGFSCQVQKSASDSDSKTEDHQSYLEHEDAHIRPHQDATERGQAVSDPFRFEQGAVFF